MMRLEIPSLPRFNRRKLLSKSIKFALTEWGNSHTNYQKKSRCLSDKIFEVFLIQTLSYVVVNEIWQQSNAAGQLVSVGMSKSSCFIRFPNLTHIHTCVSVLTRFPSRVIPKQIVLENSASSSQLIVLPYVPLVLDCLSPYLNFAPCFLKIDPN